MYDDIGEDLLSIAGDAGEPSIGDEPSEMGGEFDGVGEDEAGDDTVIGAAPARVRAAVARKVARSRKRHGNMVQQARKQHQQELESIRQKLARKRRTGKKILPVVSDAVVPAGLTRDIPVIPHTYFEATRFVVPSDLAGDFRITKIEIGGTNQFAGAGSVEARIFDESSVDNTVDWDIISPNGRLIMTVENKTGVDKVFRGAIVGQVAERQA